MSESNLEVEVHGDLIVVTQPAAQFSAIYAKPIATPQLIPMKQTSGETLSCSREHGGQPTTRRVNSGGLGERSLTARQ
jgi:hypothetical protein